MGFGWGMGSEGWLGTGIFWIAILGLVVGVAVSAFPGRSNSADGHRSYSPPPETPEQTLDRRYAMGEIDEDTYQRMRATLSSTRSVPPG